jgi:hypothetical protein
MVMKFLENLRNIDRRIMYLLLILVISLPLLPQFDFLHQDLEVQSEVRGVFEAVENVPEGKIAVMSIVWGAGTIGENRPQTEAIARHLFRSKVPFVLLSWDQQGTSLAYKTVNTVAEEMGAEYGVDWFNAGYRVPYIDQFLQSFGRDVPGTIGKDFEGRPVSSFPMMQDIKTGNDIGLVTEITPSATLESWIAFLGQPYQVPISYAPTAVLVPEGYNFLDAGQIVGMLPGLVGAAQYEQLMEVRGFASRAANALSTSHVLIIVLIILGNLGYYVSRRRQEQ